MASVRKPRPGLNLRPTHVKDIDGSLLKIFKHLSLEYAKERDVEPRWKKFARNGAGPSVSVRGPRRGARRASPRR